MGHGWNAFGQIEVIAVTASNKAKPTITTQPKIVAIQMQTATPEAAQDTNKIRAMDSMTSSIVRNIGLLLP